jgi:twinkle protein
MSEFVETHIACPKCSSSDGYSLREDGSGFCFARCGNISNGTHKKEQEVSYMTLQPVAQTYRGLTPDTMKHYGVLHEVDDKGEAKALVYRVPNGRILFRNLDKKEFRFGGERTEGLPSLFGADKFPQGSAKAITITEGFNDAMAVFQMMGSKYPVVGVQSASSAKSECALSYDYLNSFEKIYLAFDNDGPGKEAADKVARLFDFNKIYVVQLERKDPHDYLENSEAKTFEKSWWGARRFLPEGIISSLAEFDSIFDNDGEKPSVPYPFDGLQNLTFGIRGGEFVLFTAQEGIGKTEVFRALEYHLLKSTKDNIGVIHLEEAKARTLKGYVGYEYQLPVHLPEFSLSKEELKKGLRKVTDDDRLHIYSHFGSDDPDHILSTIRFMAGACGCKFVFLDHLTMVVSGLQGEDERRALDYLSTRLAMMVEELDFTLFAISHVNDEGQTRGSRNIGKVADLRIDLYRDLTAQNEVIRNTTIMTCSKNRFAGKTGPAGKLFFNPDTYCLSEVFAEEAF